MMKRAIALAAAAARTSGTGDVRQLVAPQHTNAGEPPTDDIDVAAKIVAF
jgi:hypothetical protein